MLNGKITKLNAINCLVPLLANDYSKYRSIIITSCYALTTLGFFLYWCSKCPTQVNKLANTCCHVRINFAHIKTRTVCTDFFLLPSLFIIILILQRSFFECFVSRTSILSRVYYKKGVPRSLEFVALSIIWEKQ